MTHKWLSTVGALTLSTGLLGLSVFLLRGHFQIIKDVREYALPLAADVPPLEQRLQVLKRQVELAELQSSLRSGAAEEKLRTYVLPRGDTVERLMAFMESARTFLERRKLLASMAPIQIGEPSSEGTGNLDARTIRLSATLKKGGRKQLQELMDVSGLITVGDALSPEDIRKLFQLTEGQNYAGIVPVEKFLSADLLSYVQEPRLHDERLAQAFPSEEFLSGFRHLLQESRLQRVREILQSDLGRVLVQRKLWPVQFLTIDTEEIERTGDDTERVTLTLKTYSRSGE